MPKINSNSITFVDITDSRKLEVYITSNLPTTQIKDSNTGAYSPDWTVTNLQLSANVYLDSEEITPTTIQWYTRIGTTETLVSSSSSLRINTNVLSNNPIITYICRATYQNVESFKEITFMRADTGRNGSNGADGTSVNILGSYNTLAELQTAHPTGNAGDAYIVDGDLYVWAVDDAQWENVGNIQGPPGSDGRDAKSIILTGDSQVFKVSKTNVVTPSTIKVTAYAFNTTVTNWTYSTNGGQTFLSTVPTGVSRNGNIVTVTGSTITSNSITIKASDGQIEDVFTIYKATDGSDGSKGNDGAPAPIAFLTNENVTFSANAQGQIATTTITSNVVAYNGTTKVTPTIGTISGAPTGMTITPSTITASNEVMLTITIANNSTLGSVSNNMGAISIPITSPVSTVLYLTWSKVNSGAMGVGIRSTTVTYGVSDSASTKPADTAWQSTIPTVADGQYLWTRTIIDYTDDAIADTVTYTYAKQGIKGDTGSTGSSVVISSIQYQEGTSATIPPTGTWSNSVVAVDEGRFLWTKTAFSDGKTAYGVAKQGISGSDAYTVMLTNESHIFAGDVSNAIAGSATTQVLAYKGSTAQTITITSVNGKTATTTDTDTGIAGLKFRCSALSGANPTITFTCTTSFISANGSIPIILSVGGVSFTKMFTYSIAFKGTEGTPGQPGTSASLVDITPSALYFKSTTGKGGTFSPTYIDLYPRFQNTTYNGWQYSLDGGITWVAVNNTNGVTVGTYNLVENSLRIQSTSALYTDTITSISFRCNSLTSGVYDTVSIAKIYDVVDLKVGGRNLARFTDSENWTNYLTTTVSFSEGTRTKRIRAVCNATDTATSAVFGIQQSVPSRLMKLKSGQEYTLSFLVRGNITNLSYSYLMNPGTSNNNLGGIALQNISETEFIKVSKTFTTRSEVDGSTGSYLMISHSGPKNPSLWFEIEEVKLEIGNVATDWTIAPEDIAEIQIGGRNLLTNSGYMKTLDGWRNYAAATPIENLAIENNSVYGSVLTVTGTADTSRIKVGQYIPYLQKADRTLIFSMIYRASIDATTVTMGGKYSANDSTGEYGQFYGGTVKRVDLGNGFTYMECPVNLTYTADTRSFFVYIYPRVQTVKIVWCKLEEGNTATDWTPAPEDIKSTTFQLYAPKGYLITPDVPEVTLQTFAYDGSQPITNATFKWYSWSGEAWTVINNAISTSLTVNKNNVLKSNVYKCEMTYSGKVYEATATVEDKTDIYESLIRVNAKRTSNNNMYWILYATVYSEEGERDTLLGPVSETSPTSPTTGAYWYKIDETNYTVTLMKYSGTAWAATTDKQELSYDWFLFKDATEMVSLGDKSKVKIVKSGDFVTTCNVQCNMFDAENTVLSRNNQVLNDPTDPIVSETAPVSPIDGQIWIKVGTDGSYMLSVWSAEFNKWILSNADTQNKVYVTKPEQYNEGDLWIVDSNYLPIAYKNEVAQTFRHPEKTMLRATATSQIYSDAHWVEALKYQDELDEVIGDMAKFKQFISIDDTGLTMQAKGANGAVSEFKTLLTNTELGFYQGTARVAYINNNQLNISKAEITNGLVVSGTSPQLKIGNFTLIQETNGSLSIG